MSPLKFVTISEFKAKATAIVTEIEKTKRQVVVTKNGRPVAVISPAQEDYFEYQQEVKKKSTGRKEKT